MSDDRRFNSIVEKATQRVWFSHTAKVEFREVARLLIEEHGVNSITVSAVLGRLYNAAHREFGDTRPPEVTRPKVEEGDSNDVQ